MGKLWFFFFIPIDFCIEFWNSTFSPDLEFTEGIFLTTSARAFIRGGPEGGGKGGREGGMRRQPPSPNQVFEEEKKYKDECTNTDNTI